MLERAGLGHVADRQHLEVDVAQLVLVELGARHRDRQLAAVDDRDRLSWPSSRMTHGSAPRWSSWPWVMTTASMSSDALAQVREVGQDEVDAHHLGRREAQPAVDDDDPALVLDDRQVLADLAHASQREDAQLRRSRGVTSPASSPWRGERVADVRALGVVALDERQPQRRRRRGRAWLQRGLDGSGAGGDEHAA